MASKKMKSMDTQVTDVEMQETNAPTEPVQLTIADLQTLAQVIDLSSRRGAFQAGELSQVGEVYNKLVGFLAQVANSQKKEEAAKAETTTV